MFSDYIAPFLLYVLWSSYICILIVRRTVTASKEKKKGMYS